MKAALYDRYGPAREVLRVEDVERPEPGPGEVRVRMEFSGVNPTDWKSRSGATPRPIDGFQIPHHDGAGVIDAVGEGVDRGRVGQRVWLWMAAAGRRWGTAAEWTVVPVYAAVPLPDGVSAELGASLGVPALTAHRCLFADGSIDGQTVLVAGGSSPILGRPAPPPGGPGYGWAAAGSSRGRPMSRLPVRQGWSTASFSSRIAILSLTTAPPVSMTAAKLTPKSRRLISPMALNPARVPP